MGRVLAAALICIPGPRRLKARRGTCDTSTLLQPAAEHARGVSQWDSVLLDAVDRRAVYLSEGLGHAFCALEDRTTAHYLCSAAYNPSAEHGIHPLDQGVGLDLPDGIEPLLSPKDAA